MNGLLGAEGFGDCGFGLVDEFLGVAVFGEVLAIDDAAVVVDDDDGGVNTELEE